MLKNRIIMLLVIAMTTTFASLFGGVVTRGIFYFSLVVILFAFIYTFYVHLRFSGSQSINSQVIIKGEEISYSYNFSNNDIIPYTNISFEFFDDKSKIENNEILKSYCILPEESYEMQTEITCLYRGNYNIGIKKIIVTDFFELFKISYPPKLPLKIKVLPRIFRLIFISIFLDNTDEKKTSFSVFHNKEQPDIDMRKYINGDNKKMIHWKVTAKKQELYTRKYSNTSKQNVVVLMDLVKINERNFDTIKTEDKIIETTISILDYYFRKNTPTTVLFSSPDISKINIHTRNTFDDFYNMCADFDFKSKTPAWQLLIHCNQCKDYSGLFILITHSITKELCFACYNALELGNSVTIIFIDMEKAINSSITLDSRVNIITIDNEQEILEALERK